MNYLYVRKQLLEPKSRNEDDRRRELILNVLLASSTIAGLAALLLKFVQFFTLGAAGYAGEPLLFALLQVTVFAGLWFLSRKGFFILAAYALITIFLLLGLYMLSGWGILLPQGVLILALVLFMSSILLGTRVSAVLTIVASLSLITLGSLQQHGRITFDASWMKSPGGPADAIGFSLTLAVITIVSWLSNRQVERFHVMLQQRVDQATARLSSANRKLKELDHVKDDFISMASHQLGTPLTAITGYLSMALDEDQHNLTSSQREYIGYALEASERMMAMSADLLNASRLSSGRFSIQRSQFDLGLIARQEVEELRPSAERKGLVISYEAPTEAIGLNLDESKTRQVVMNFIDNAIYYTESGRIQVRLQRDGDQAVFTVTDTGIGVPRSDQGKLFAKFYRAGNAKAVRPDGTGLGLYLAKKVVEEQGGDIVFSSTEGQGSTFGFRLPIGPAGS